MTVGEGGGGADEKAGGRSKRGSHQLAATAQCPYLWYMRYDQGYDSVKDKPFRKRGTLHHLALAYHYVSKMPAEAQYGWFRRQGLQEALEEKGAGMPDAIQRSLEMVLAYRQEYARENWETIAVEEEFYARVGDIDSGAPAWADRTVDDEEISCRPDLLVRIPEEDIARMSAQSAGATGAFLGGGFGLGGLLRPKGRLWVIDYKSARRPWGDKPGLEKWNPDGEYALNWQILVNLHVLRLQPRFAAEEIAGFVIKRMTREPDTRGYYYFDEHIVKVPALAYEEARREIRECVIAERATRDLVRLGIRPRRHFWSCTTRYGACDMHELCRARDVEKRLEILREQFTRERE